MRFSIVAQPDELAVRARVQGGSGGALQRLAAPEQERRAGGS